MKIIMKKQRSAGAEMDPIRHSLAHLLAAAVLEKYPKAKLGIGPTIENGFYYDFLFPRPVTTEDLAGLEKRMRELARQDLPFRGKKGTPAEARKAFKDQPFKLDLIKEFVKEKKGLSIYRTGDVFQDLCRGGHVKSTREINPDAFKLTHLAGAYWRGDEKNPQLTRVYGLAFATKDELQKHLHMLEEAKRRDHRKLGADLDIFFFRDEVGPGLPLWTDKGATIRRELERFIVDEEVRRGYQHVYTPDLARVRLYEISGHYPYYKDTMYPVMQVDEDKLVLRPMTCPHHFMIFSQKPRSYKELPMPIAEVAKLYRYEKSGELTGLLRVRSFCLADSHIFCTKEQAAGVIRDVIDLIDYSVGVLGFRKGEDYWYRLSLGDPKNKKKYYNDPAGWREGEATLRKVLKSIQAPFYEAKDEAAFYGPKIDIQMKNVLGKEDTVFTVQYDFCLPARFGLKYVNAKGKEEQPVVVHRSSVGALERTIAFLIEKFAGALPLWLSPIQAAILPVGDKFGKYAEKIVESMKKAGIRAELRVAEETLGKRIRAAEMEKTPYILVVGEREEKSGTVNVRHYRRGQEGEIGLESLIEKISEEIRSKVI